MQIQIQNHQQQRQIHLKIIPLQEYYVLKPTANLSQQQSLQLINKTFLMFVIQIRTGMEDSAIKILKNNILDNCQQAIQKGVHGLGFIINGQYYTTKKPSYQAFKNILDTSLIYTQNNDYLVSLRKLNQTVVSESKRIEQTSLSLIFFTSFVKIDHSLGFKKQSYVDKLNEHCQECTHEILHLQKILRKLSCSCKSYILMYENSDIEKEDYSECDIDLMNLIAVHIGNCNGIIMRSTSFNTISENLCNIMNLIIYSLSSIQLQFPKISKQFAKYNKIEEKIENNEQQIQYSLIRIKKQKGLSIVIRSEDCKNYDTQETCYILKSELDLMCIKNKQILISGQDKNNCRVMMQLSENDYFTSEYTQPTQIQQIVFYTKIHSQVLNNIAKQLIYYIISYVRIYDGNNKSHLQFQYDEQLQWKLQNKVNKIQEHAKNIHEKILKNKHSGQKRILYEAYYVLKLRLDCIQGILCKLFKKQVSNQAIGILTEGINHDALKRSLQNKLVRRINANPKMVSQIYQKIKLICSSENNDWPSLQYKYNTIKSKIGNCVVTDSNFVKALAQEDCLALIFEVQRPSTAVADPGRIKIRQISPHLVCVSEFFKMYHYSVLKVQSNHIWFEYENNFLRDQTNMNEKFERQKWDYSERNIPITCLGLIPLYICAENWKVARLLMKPCLGWTCCGQPLAYCFSQFQIVPFMVLSFLIRRCQQLQYQIDDVVSKAQHCQKQQELYLLQHTRNNLKRMRQRMQVLQKVIQQTCCIIMQELSHEKNQYKLSQITQKIYSQYEDPLNRTLDVICNNYTFLGQLFCCFKMGLIKLPPQQKFHYFFIRLVEQQLRRQTNGWKDEEMEITFMNKLLNTNVDEMQVPEYIVLQSKYYDRFVALNNGQNVEQTYFQIQRKRLEMKLVKGGKFSDLQKMILIQYKRLYQNRVIWIWYIRFALYHQHERISIHKWKSLGLMNSFMLFTMIIQNKKCRKNSKRREAIKTGNYADPFDYCQARLWLERQFMELRMQKQSVNIKMLNAKKYNTAADVFSYSKSLKQAAGALINITIGNQIPLFFNKIVTGNAVFIEYKLQMIKQGKYQGLRLFPGWIIGRKKMNRLRKKYPYEFQKYQYLF